MNPLRVLLFWRRRKDKAIPPPSASQVRSNADEMFTRMADADYDWVEPKSKS